MAGCFGHTQNSSMEVRVYEDVAVLAASFSVAHSKWSQRFSADVAMVRVKETLDYDIRPSDVHEVWRPVGGEGCVDFVQRSLLLKN